MCLSIFSTDTNLVTRSTNEIIGKTIFLKTGVEEKEINRSFYFEFFWRDVAFFKQEDLVHLCSSYLGGILYFIFGCFDGSLTFKFGERARSEILFPEKRITKNLLKRVIGDMTCCHLSPKKIGSG